MPLTQVYKNVKDGVVQVLALQGSNVISSGSGSVINDGRYVLTCEHCIVTNTQVAIRDPHDINRAIFGKVIFADSNLDIALIEFDRVVGTPVTLKSSSSAETGNGAFVVGYPMGVYLSKLSYLHTLQVRM